MNNRPALRPDTPLGQALRAAARGILTEARDAISDPSLKPDEAVHDFRKAVKRWRAFLRLIEPHFGNRAAELRADARDTAKKLAGARDLRSVLDAIEDIRKDAHELNDRELETIRGRVAAIQADAESREISPGDRAEIAHEVTRWLATVSQWPFEGIRFAEISESLTAGYRRGRKASPRKWRDANEEALHKFRRRVIDHRYQLELIEPLWPRMTRVWVDEAQRLRDALGRHRDLALLQAMAGPHQPLARFRSRLGPAIERRQKTHLAQAEKIAARVFAEKPGAFESRIERLWSAGHAGERDPE